MLEGAKPFQKLRRQDRDMGVDWGFAGQIGGFGFGLVFLVLIVLALAIWLVGLVLRKTSTSKGETNNKKKGD